MKSLGILSALNADAGATQRLRMQKQQKEKQNRPESIGPIRKGTMTNVLSNSELADAIERTHCLERNTAAEGPKEKM